MQGTSYSRRGSAFERLARRRMWLSGRRNEPMDTPGLRGDVRMSDVGSGNEPHRAAAAVRARGLLPLAGMLLLAWGAAPARANTTIIDTSVTGPITVNAGETVEIHT